MKNSPRLFDGRYVSVHNNITGIVVWGLVLIGSVACFGGMYLLEPLLADQHDKRFLEVENKIHAILPLQVINIDAKTAAQLLLIYQDSALNKIEVIVGAKHFVYSERERAASNRIGLDSYKFSLPLKQPNSTEVIVILTQPSLAVTITEFRKKMIIAMGAVFMFFGFILQQILRVVLTKPFQKMVNTAQQFQANPSSRFNQHRYDEFGFLASFINQILDDLVDQHQQLLDEKERVDVTLKSIGDAVITTNLAAEVMYMNPAAERLTGWQNKEAVMKPLTLIMRVVNTQSHVPIVCSAIECIKKGEIIERSLDQCLLRDDDVVFEIEGTTAPIHDSQGGIIGAVVVFQNVQNIRQMSRQLSYLASHDGLTNLYNRREFEHQVQMALDEYNASGKDSAILYLDLDHFKIVNDTSGHIAGDELLCQIGLLLTKQMRETDTVARLGGDEFGVLLRGCDSDNIGVIAEALCKTIGMFKFSWKDKLFEVGASIGVLSLSDGVIDLSEVLIAADVACFTAKEKGRNCIHVYQYDEQDKEHDHQQMFQASNISQALEDDRFCLYYQDIVAINDDNGQYHYEILIRGIDNDGAVIAPNAFLPAAERYNLMPKIDRWVINHLFKNTCDFINQQFNSTSVTEAQTKILFAVNLSGKTFSDDNFLEFVEQQLTDYDFPAQALCFEITETAAIANLVKASEFIKVLKKRGCKFALDDFGSGVSSFYYLKNLAVDFLKIDGSYVKNLVHDPVDRAMVTAVNQIAHAIGIQTTAEFVEDQETVECLKEIGVDFAQGYAFSKPQPLENLLTKSNKLKLSKEIVE